MAAIYTPVSIPRNIRLRTFDVNGVQAFVGANAANVNRTAECSESVDSNGYLTLRRSSSLVTSVYAKRKNITLPGAGQKLRIDFAINAGLNILQNNGSIGQYVGGVFVENFAGITTFCTGGCVNAFGNAYTAIQADGANPQYSLLGQATVENMVTGLFIPNIIWYRIELVNLPGIGVLRGYTYASMNGFDWAACYAGNEPRNTICFGLGLTNLGNAGGQNDASVTLCSYTETLI